MDIPRAHSFIVIESNPVQRSPSVPNGDHVHGRYLAGSLWGWDLIQRSAVAHQKDIQPQDPLVISSMSRFGLKEAL